jgi:hypothetical protein
MVAVIDWSGLLYVSHDDGAGHPPFPASTFFWGKCLRTTRAQSGREIAFKEWPADVRFGVYPGFKSDITTTAITTHGRAELQKFGRKPFLV